MWISPIPGRGAEIPTGQPYPFKTGKAEPPRVRQVLGFLHGIQLETLLDVGSGRGVLLSFFAGT